MCSVPKERGCCRLLHPGGVRVTAASLEEGWDVLGRGGSGARGLAAAAVTSLQAVFCVVLAALGKKEDASDVRCWDSGLGRWQERHA